MPRAQVLTILLSIIRLEAVAGEPMVVDTEAIADGGVVAATVEAPAVASTPYTVFSVPVELDAPLILRPVALPTRLRFLIVSLSALVTMVVASAIRTSEVKVTVAAAVF